MTMKIARFRMDAVRIGEQLFDAIIDNDENIEFMTNALTGDVCDISVIYNGVLLLRDDRLGDDFEDMKVETSELFSEVRDE